MLDDQVDFQECLSDATTPIQRLCWHLVSEVSYELKSNRGATPLHWQILHLISQHMEKVKNERDKVH